MKVISFFFFASLLVLNLRAQDTLVHLVNGLGTEMLIFNENDGYKYESSLCGGTFLSFGSVKNAGCNYKLIHDSLLCPRIQIRALRRDTISLDSLYFEYYDILTKESVSILFYDVITPESTKRDQGVLKIARKDLNTDTISFEFIGDTIALKLDTNFNFHLIEYPYSFYYSCGETGINKVTRKKEFYLVKKISYSFHETKTWKTVKKRYKFKYYPIKKD